MKTYRRTEPGKGFSRITEVDERGRYEQWVEWPNGTVMSHTRTTLKKMGWANLKQFLTFRPHFELVKGEQHGI